MDTIKLGRLDRIKIFLYEYYFGVSTLIIIFRIIGGPMLFYLGISLYSSASDRFGIGYGAILMAYSIYYALKPFLWILFRWKVYKPIEFGVEATPDFLIIKEGNSESKTEYEKFNAILKRKHYFAIRIQKGLKLYIPIKMLSESNIAVLNEKPT